MEVELSPNCPYDCRNTTAHFTFRQNKLDTNLLTILISTGFYYILWNIY